MLVAALVVALVVGVLLATGDFSPTSPSSSSGSGKYETYRQAEPRAQSGVSATPGGPWSPVFGAAVATPFSSSVPGANLTGLSRLSSCTVNWTGGTAPKVTVPATPESASAGTAAFWTFGFVNGSDELRIVSVSDGNTSVLATISGSTCTEEFASLVPLTSGSVVDSPTVAENASAAGGGSWLTAHPNATLTWDLLPGVSVEGIFSTAPTWHAVYTTCSLSSPVGSEGAEFNATLAAATGAVTAHTSGPTVCGASGGVSLTVVPAGVDLAARQAI